MARDSQFERLEILAGVNEIADGSFTPRETVARLLDLLVPAVADTCMVDAVGPDGGVQRLGVRFSGPRARELEDALAVRPLSPEAAPRSETRTLLGGESQVFEVTDELLRAASHGPGDLELLRAFQLRWLVMVPLRARGRTVGTLALGITSEERRYDDHDRRFAEILAGRIALALENARLRMEVGEVEHELAAILGSLADAVTVQDADGQLVYANQAAAELLGFSSPAELLEAGGTSAMAKFEVWHEDGRPVAVEELPGRRVLAGEEPEPLLVRSVLRDRGEARWCVTKATAVRDEAGDVRLAVNIIEDVTPQKDAERAQRLLAEASDILFSSLDYEATLTRVAQLAVPELADWCGFDMPDERGGVHQVALAHADPGRIELARELREAYPADADAGTGLGAVMRSGRSEIYPEISDEMLADAAQDARHLELLREIGLRSVIIVPVAAGPHVLGALTLVASDSRRFDEADLQLAEELGRRAGTAVANARVFSERSEIAGTLQRSLLPPRLPEMPGWSAASMFQPAGAGVDVGGDFYDVFEAGGDWYAVIGDVAGKGAPAAALTSLARYTLRGVIAATGDPAQALAQLNALLRERDQLSLCSVACLRLADARVETVCAGHPRPLLVRNGGVEEIGTVAPLLGAFDDGAWPLDAGDIAPGDGLVLYTDGVTDTVGESGRFGDERTREALRRAGPSAADLIVELRVALDSFRRGPHPDDTAVLALVRQA